MASAASTMSTRYSFSGRIDFLRAGQHPVAQDLLQPWFWNQINRTSQQIGQLALHAGQGHEADLGTGIEINQDIHIAVRAKIIA